MKFIVRRHQWLPQAGVFLHLCGDRWSIQMPWLWPLRESQNRFREKAFILLPGFRFCFILPYRFSVGWSRICNRFGEQFGRRKHVARISFGWFYCQGLRRWRAYEIETLLVPHGPQHEYEFYNWFSHERYREDCQ